MADGENKKIEGCLRVPFRDKDVSVLLRVLKFKCGLGPDRKYVFLAKDGLIPRTRGPRGPSAEFQHFLALWKCILGAANQISWFFSNKLEMHIFVWASQIF